jgi:hypothetical protein
MGENAAPRNGAQNELHGKPNMRTSVDPHSEG